MKALIIDLGSTKTPEIMDMAERSGFYAIRFKYREPWELPDLEGFGAVILSGSPILITEGKVTEPFNALGQHLESFAGAVLGICCGHQILGIHDGAEIFRCEEDRDGQTIRQSSPSRLLQELDDEFLMIEDHCEAITCPPNYRIVASSAICENEAMEHRTLPRFGVQFHPEISGINGQRLMDNFYSVAAADERRAVI